MANNQIPNQKEIDKLAMYFQLCIQLSRSPFYRQDSLTLEYQGRGASAPQVHLSGYEVIGSTVMIFRKLWSNDELTRFHRIHDILRKFAPNDGVALILDSMLNDIKSSLKEWELNPVVPYGITPTELIRIVINTEYAHAGMGKSRKQKPTRPAYEELCQRLTPEKVANLFETALLKIGSEIYQHGYTVPAAITYFIKNGSPEPSVILDSSAGYYLNMNSPKSNITRGTPGYSPTKESRSDALERVLKRHRYREVQGIFATLFGENEIPYNAMTRHRNLSELFEEYRIKMVMHEGDIDFDSRRTFLVDHYFSGPDDYPRIKGRYIVLDYKTVLCTNQGWKLLEILYDEAHLKSLVNPESEILSSETELIQQYYQHWV